MSPSYGIIPCAAVWRSFCDHADYLELRIVRANRINVAEELGSIVAETWWSDARIQSDHVAARKIEIAAGRKTRVDVADTILTLRWRYYRDLMGNGSAAPMYSGAEVLTPGTKAENLRAALVVADRIGRKVMGGDAFRDYGERGTDVGLHDPRAVALAVDALKIPRLVRLADPVFEAQYPNYWTTPDRTRFDWYRDVRRGDDGVPFHFGAADVAAWEAGRELAAK
jgi:hypothetical protein